MYLLPLQPGPSVGASTGGLPPSSSIERGTSNSSSWARRLCGICCFSFYKGSAAVEIVQYYIECFRWWYLPQSVEYSGEPRTPSDGKKRKRGSTSKKKIHYVPRLVGISWHIRQYNWPSYCRATTTTTRTTRQKYSQTLLLRRMRRGILAAVATLMLGM